MVVLDSVPGLEITVVVDKAPLKEYLDDEIPDEPNSNKTTRYVEAKSGSEFQVCHKFSNDFERQHPLLLGVSLDGKPTSSASYSHEDLEWFCDHHSGGSISGKKETIDGQLCMRKFTFSPLTTADIEISGDVKDVQKRFQRVGELVVGLYWLKATKVPGPRPPREESHTSQNTAMPVDSTVPEKALKGRAISHSASLGPPTPLKPPKSNNSHWTRFEYLGKSAFATYVFKYRSKDALKSLCIIPRTPSPVPLQYRPAEELGAEELRELLRQREQADAARPVKQERVKRERPNDNEDEDQRSDTGVEIVGQKRRRLPITLNEDGVEMIDLT
ncbi:hypothetical protein BCR34DRAFT_565684 [Clohesyomyces aquaticus]|uniref:DUF7918 domain-containing protein n=1 Tax=Clohesyomyces aquaticus TaxID=1231657 RepID=A0A1Y1ZLH4_9PLEO|nr:hypothetical protein BCR34DRAFT_565684 [Clohesyomyces aquaticus]